jgi:hypothetical protein
MPVSELLGSTANAISAAIDFLKNRQILAKAAKPWFPFPRLRGAKLNLSRRDEVTHFYFGASPQCANTEFGDNLLKGLDL